MATTLFLFDFFLFDIAGWIEPLDLSGDPARKGRRVELSDRSDAGLAGSNRIPRRFGPDP